MRLRKLILHGFKSFADKTEFEFQDGITVIVGPNGCGKSNVVDAVKWVLGEQRPSSLRGKEMQDVIFSGTEGRKGVGYAEVSLVLDNSAGTLSIDFSEVMVTRRLYKSGESEYLINGNTVRLRDVREMLMDSGGGPGALTVMEQGNIDRLLRADPRERRMVFEEAAGIAKYRARRKETERKLERTAENLARLLDILSEYETRERSLKIQAGKARRWKELTEELKRKRLTGALARYADLARRRDDAVRALGGVEQREREARAVLESAMETSEGSRAELDALRELIGRQEAELAAMSGEARAAEEKQAAREREATELLERAETATGTGAEAQRRAMSLEADLASARREREEAAGQTDRRAEALRAAEALLREVEGRVSLLREERDGLDGARVEAYGAETRARNEEIACDAELKALDGRVRRLAERATSSGLELENLERERDAARLGVRSVEERLRAFEDRSTAAEEAGREARAEAETMGEEASRLAGEEAALQARREMLQRLVDEGEGLSAGTRALLDAARDGSVAGVEGTVAECIGDAGAQAAALDRALGDLAGAVVVETTDQALAALRWLRDGRRGRARILPRDRLGHTAPPERFAGLPEAASALVGGLLEGTRIVATLEEALAHRGERVVVDTGEELGREGTLLGGTGDAGAGLVTRGAELAEVRKRLATTAAARREAAERVDAARTQAARWDRALAELKPLLKAAREEQRELRDRLAATEKAAASRAGEMDLERAERTDVEALIAECTARREKARQLLATAQEEVASLEAESADLQERLRRASADREDAAARCTEAKVEAARWTEKAEAAALKVRALEESIASALREAEARTEEAATCRERRTACLDEVESLKRLAVEREKNAAALAKRIEQERGKARAMQEEIEAGGRRVRELRQAHEAMRTELETWRLKENELRLRVETLLEEVRRDHAMNLQDVEMDAEAAAADPAALEAEIQELRTKLERLGNVNHTALEELAQVEEKISFMRKEEADLRAADRQLRETIEKIDQVCMERFTDTFEKVKEHFHTTFRKLFGGGRAEIFLEEPDNVLESGIEIRVRPPGKDLRNMALLSGGERSLTTVALLFSIYQTKPPPFCLLDEVDAALDESNTVRMCEMLKEFAAKGQFLVITHARPTMTVADRLYGVTMPEAGVSRRVSVQFADIEAGRVVGLN